MNFQYLHELLRLELLRRIEQGALTGSKLAQQTGFRQAHISNFLNKKRSLSLEGLDRVLAAQELTIDQLLPVDLQAAHAPGSEPMEVIPVVSPSVAMESAAVMSANIIETVHVSGSRLADNRARVPLQRAHWQRYLAMRVDAQQAAAMEPVLSTGTIAVLDRHYNSLAPYRAHQPTLYAVRCGGALLLRFVDYDESRLILRPYSRSFPVQLVPIEGERAPSDYIVGRVCMLISEL